MATLSTSSLAVGSHSITAAYSGDNNFDPSTSSVVTQTVQQASTTVTIASDVNPSGFNQLVTFTATITPQFGGQVTGTVTFVDGAISLGMAPVSGNSASLSTSALAVGTHSITASYAGDSNFTGSSFSALTQIVNPVTTTTTLTSSPNPAAVSQTISFTATVAAPFGGTPTGTVTFMTAAKTLGTAVLTTGVASINAAFASPGTRTVTVTYSGDANFVSSTSAPLQQGVNKAGSGTTLSASPNPSTVGETVTFTSTVVGQFGGKPTGTVTYKDGSTTLGSSKLSGGVAQFSTSSLLRGKHKITTSYGGDANFKSSSGSLTQVVR